MLKWSRKKKWESQCVKFTLGNVSVLLSLSLSFSFRSSCHGGFVCVYQSINECVDCAWVCIRVEHCNRKRIFAIYITESTVQCTSFALYAFCMCVCVCQAFTCLNQINNQLSWQRTHFMILFIATHLKWCVCCVHMIPTKHIKTMKRNHIALNLTLCCAVHIRKNINGLQQNILQSSSTMLRWTGNGDYYDDDNDVGWWHKIVAFTPRNCFPHRHSKYNHIITVFQSFGRDFADF